MQSVSQSVSLWVSYVHWSHTTALNRKFSETELSPEFKAHANGKFVRKARAFRVELQKTWQTETVTETEVTEPKWADSSEEERGT
jgi:hypothetical protein